MDGDIQIRAVGRPHRELLIAMYDRFDPLGPALGLPPCVKEARRAWVDLALSHKMNLGALSPCGSTVGHCFLVADKADSAELAIFVHQDFRRRGVGTALLKAALECGSVWALRRIWTLTGSATNVASHLLGRCGFRLTNAAFYGAELEIHLPVACTPR
jgi:GNAT superfamily N-acetyltransferase